MRALVSVLPIRELCNLLGQPWLALTRMKHGTGALLVNRYAECSILRFPTQRAAHARSVGRCCLQRNSRRAPQDSPAGLPALPSSHSIAMQWFSAHDAVRASLITASGWCRSVSLGHSKTDVS